jgi:hypothetical protein
MRPDVSARHAEIDPRTLLARARELSTSPYDTDLRRAASAAFHAVFHALVGHAVRHLMPNAHRADQLRLARSFDPGSVAEVCRWMTRVGAPGNASALGPLIRPLLDNRRLAEVAAGFLTLRQVRHHAEYDHLATFTRPGVAADVELASTAVADLGQLGGSRDGHLFFVLVAAQKVLQ